ncbi:MAG TPA: lamin tail domain-containing protein [Candidatus Saccharimonadales bacterium]
MKQAISKIPSIFLTGLLFACIVPAARTQAAVPIMSAPTGLSLLEVKMTGSEFILLHNNSVAAISNLSSYWLTAYNNVNPLAAGVSSFSQQLPATSLDAGQTLLLSADPMATCGASVAGDLSVSMSDGGGFLQLTQTSLNDAGAIIQMPADVVSWSSGVGGVIQNVPSNSKDPRSVFYRYLNGGSYAWQQASLDQNNVCQLNVLVVGGSGSSSAVTPLTLAATSPPATILGVQSIGENGAAIPANNVGLQAPQLSELLPNPVGSGNDTTDEFIELYNPNPKPFELSGYTLYVGATTMRGYTFPTGTTLEANSFRAFMSKDTKLSLSNTSSQVELTDPFGRTLSKSDLYKNAKDGVSRAAAGGSWHWTVQVTPGAANVIKPPAAVKAISKTKSKTKQNANVQSVSGATAAAGTSASSFQSVIAEAPIHMWVLALIAGGALLYGAYEYRRDIANRLFQFRAKFGFGRAAWRTPKGRRSD